MKRLSDCTKKERTGVAVGIGLIALGAIGLGAVGLAATWVSVVWRIANRLVDLLWPICLMVVGGLILWAAVRGRLDDALSGRFNGPLSRSSSDSRLEGVCGGLAHFLGIDSVAVRLIFVMLFIASPLLCLVTYVILAIVMPRS